MLPVQNNLLAQNANRNLKVNTGKNAKITEKLSSGYKINRAADDASGLSMSEKMRRQIRGMHQSADNINEGVGYVQTAEGALNEVQDILQRINQLSVKAANGTNTPEDRAYIDQEIQQLKKEMNRIFSETTFNEKKIWEPRESRVIDYQQQIAVTVRTPSSLDVTNENCGVISSNGYTIKPSDDGTGVCVSWTGYNGTQYTSDTVSWEDFESNNYSFDLSKKFKKENTDLFGKDGLPVFTIPISLKVHDYATLDDVKAAIGTGKTIGASASVSLGARFENADDSLFPTPGVSASVSLYYTTAYKSHLAGGYDFDDANDGFMEAEKSGGKTNLTSYPKEDTVDAARGSTTTWEFSFNVKGFGTVTATSPTYSYRADDGYYSQYRDEDGKDLWWYTGTYSDGRKYTDWRTYPRTSDSKGTLGNVMDALTGDRNDPTPGLLNSKNQGISKHGGQITLSYSLKDGSGTQIGSLSIYFRVNNGESEDDVLKKIKYALNENTLLDVYNDSKSNDTHSFYISQYNQPDHKIEIPIYGGICGFYVQGGTESGQHIGIQYEALSTIVLGMKDTNVLTQESAGNAINEVKAALQIVSKQRSDFGAYQNRLEHAYNINKNVEENTQSSESVIRDTDIAEMMMEYSVNNILMQAGTSMLTQANQSKQSVLELLN